MKHIIVSHFVNDKNKEGVPFKTKKGEPFSKVTIKIEANPKNPKEWDDKYISGLSFNATDDCLSWKPGDEVDILIEKNNEFWNFKTPSRLNLLENTVKQAVKDIEILKAFMVSGIKDEVDNKFPTIKEDETSRNLNQLLNGKEGPEDIPF